MSEDNRNRAKSEQLDDFWDIESLLPERGARPVTAQARPAPRAMDIEIDARRTSADKSANAPVPLTYTPETALPPRPVSSTVHYIPPHTADEGGEAQPLLDYRPDGVLLQRVQVYEWASNFHYFDRFDKEAAEFDTMQAPAAASPESFFSYFPQYVQLNSRRTAWYLRWREQVRQGAFPETDYAYILLYIFELINLDVPNPETAARRRDSMASVWVAYRKTYPRLDQYMCEWLCDYCLIHRLSAPVDILAPALDTVIATARLKEFYLLPVISAEHMSVDMTTARILLRHCCQYDYRKSKFAQGEHKALFDKTVPAALSAVLPLLLGGGDRPPAVTMLASTVTRDAYTGALCSYRHKRRVVVAYTSFSRSHELRFLMGDMVKHIENRLRAWLGVRSRLSVMSLPLPLRDALDAYLNPIAPPKSFAPRPKKEPPRPDYEAQYDKISKPISLSDAATIEEASWETTRILTEAFAEDIPDDVQPTVPAAAEMPTETENTLADALAPYKPFVAAALAGDKTAQRAYADAVHKMPDAVADEINAVTADVEIFDMVLEDDGTGFYGVIEDYREILHAYFHEKGTDPRYGTM